MATVVVTVTLPTGKTTAHYGALNLPADSSGNVAVPDYVAKHLVAAGATSGTNVSGVDEVTAITNGDPYGANYIGIAWNAQPWHVGLRYTPPGTSDFRSNAVTVFQNQGVPPVTFT